LDVEVEKGEEHNPSFASGWAANDRWTKLLIEKEAELDSKPRVKWEKKKREAFYKLGYNENHIPNQGRYEKLRKPRLEQWDNPAYDWPPRIPRPSRHKGEALILGLERSDLTTIKANRELTIPDFRAGDVIKLTVKGSISEAKEYEYQGVCIGKSAPNSIRAKCAITFALDQTNVIYNAQLYNPMISNFEILKYGSNQNRKKLNHIPKLQLSNGRLQEPVIRGRGYTDRLGSKKIL